MTTINREWRTLISDPVSGISAVDDEGFQLRDGRLVVEPGLWSIDGGRTWVSGSPGPRTGGYKTALERFSGEILSIYRTTINNGTKSVQIRNGVIEEASVNTPLTKPPIGDTCQPEPDAGVLFHHGLIEYFPNHLVASVYAQCVGDDDPAPNTCGFPRFRCLALHSYDGGLSWENPITIGDPGITPASAAREGFTESTLVKLLNGELICFMRTSPADITPFTPLYASKSSDCGETWSLPYSVAGWGTNPQAVELENGALVLVYGGNDGHLQVSWDRGISWTVPVQVTRSEAYLSVFEAGPEAVITTYYDADLNGFAAARWSVRL